MVNSNKTMTVFLSLLFFFVCITLSNAAAADILQNPDFEIPPSNITENSTSQFLLLHNERNRIPGWSFNGTVWYVTPAANLSIPGNGHAIQLGENGQINQTFEASSDIFSEYILTFTLAAQNEDCFKNSTAVNVSVLDQRGGYRSLVFSLGGNFSKTLSLNFGFYLGYWSANLEIKSVAPNSEQNFTCWPIVDNLLVQSRGSPIFLQDGNYIPNGDFEVGPAISQNSGGILLQDYESPTSDTTRLLERWKILGTVKYIDSKHFKVPQGNAAIELLSGPLSGIRADFEIPRKGTFDLNFTIGDANDSCVGDLLVFLEVGNDIRNFTLQSSGMGVTSNYSVNIVGSESLEYSSISFYTRNETWATDGVLCGPVLDSIRLYMTTSNSGEMKLWRLGVIFSLVLGSMIFF